MLDSGCQLSRVVSVGQWVSVVGGSTQWWELVASGRDSVGSIGL